VARAATATEIVAGTRPSPLTWRRRCAVNPAGFHAAKRLDDERLVASTSTPARGLRRKTVVEEHWATARCTYCGGERIEVRTTTTKGRE
jgi:hypothetical protein